MSLTAKDVEIIMRLLKDSAFDELDLEMDGLKLTLRRPDGDRAAAAAPFTPLPPAPALEQANVPTSAPAEASAPRRERAARAKDHEAAPVVPVDARTVVAPLLGTFYRAPRPGAPPFVEVGSEVEADTVIGIIEVMKLMNAVRAGMRGRIAANAVQDGATVEYGQALMQLEDP